MCLRACSSCTAGKHLPAQLCTHPTTRRLHPRLAGMIRARFQCQGCSRACFCSPLCRCVHCVRDANRLCPLLQAKQGD